MDKYIPFFFFFDIEKIVSIINISNEDFLSNFDKMSNILGEISQRQVSYYLSATAYFGIIETKNRKKVFTKLGIYLKNLNYSMQIAEIITIILGDPVFRKTYVFQKLYGERVIDDIELLIKEYHPECTNEVCHRRAQTVISWVKWIIKKIN